MHYQNYYPRSALQVKRKKSKNQKETLRGFSNRNRLQKQGPFFNRECTLAVLSTLMEEFVVDTLSTALKCSQDRDVRGLQCIASQMQHQGTLGKLCLLGLEESNAQVKTVESLFNLDLLQRMPEHHQLHQSYSGCTCAELPKSTGSTQIPKSLWALHHTIKTKIA